MSKIFYITTPLYYVNARPHVGHAYTTIAADILRRHKRMRGEEAYLLTGTDEHGSKIEEAARAAGKEPHVFADEISQSFRDLWKRLDVQYDDFIRTTELRHEARVQGIFQMLLKSGAIYKGMYSGFYCVSCETYWTETDVAEARERRAEAGRAPEAGEGAAEAGAPACPDCRKPLKRVEEESYFFRLSKYQEPLLERYRKHPELLQPPHRANEILRFVESGLRDLSVSRTKVAWGIRVPEDPSHTIYVWFDALLNYVTAAGYRPPGAALPEEASKGGADRPPFEELWPADVQLVGKEIYRFHAVIWPAMLMALGLDPPRTVFAHGWWTMEGEKMSKSRGNILEAQEVIREFGASGVDTLRYFLFREMPFGNDGAFSLEAVRRRYNAELANDLGNLLKRVTDMVDMFLNGELPRRPPLDRPFISKEVAGESRGIYESMDRLAFSDALSRIWSVVSRLNRYVDKEAPWTVAKTDPERFKFLMFDLVWSLRIVAGWLEPFMPQSSAKMQMQLGVRRVPGPLTPEELLSGDSGFRIQKAPPLFPRK